MDKVWYVDNVTGNGHWMDAKYEVMPDHVLAGCKGHARSAKTRQKMSEASKGRKKGPMSKETKHNLSISIKEGYSTRKKRKYGPLSDETKRQISEKLTGRKASKKSRQKLRENWRKRNAKLNGRNAAICADDRPTKEIAKDYNLSRTMINWIKRTKAND